MRSYVVAAVALAVISSAEAARASQYLFVDKLGTIVGANKFGGSHYDVPALPDGQPANWTTPVDFTKATAYVRVEVKTKPSSARMTYAVCFFGYKKDGSLLEFACNALPYFTAPGVYNISFRLPTVWQFNLVDWTRHLRSVDLVTYKGPGVDNQVNYGPLYYPSLVRFSVTLVSPGGTYVPPPGVPAVGPPADGGADGPDANPSDASGPDARPPDLDGQQATDAMGSDLAAAATDPAPRPDARSEPMPAAPSGEGTTGEPPPDTTGPSRHAGGGCAFGGGRGGSAAAVIFIPLLIPLGVWLGPARARARRNVRG